METGGAGDEEAVEVGGAGAEVGAEAVEGVAGTFFFLRPLEDYGVVCSILLCSVGRFYLCIIFTSIFSVGSKRLGRNIGCKDKTSSWHLIGFPDDGGLSIGSTV